jgi:antitoxin component YwqK of YwqJK toxin-antitoxin module
MYGYKSAMNENTPVVITLFLGEISNSNVNRYYVFKSLYAKHRCDRAFVTKIEDDNGKEYDCAECSSVTDGVTGGGSDDILKIYLNKYIISKEYDKNKENVNGKGITFFLNKDLARNYKRKIGTQLWNNINNMYITFYNNGCMKERIFFIYSPIDNTIIEHTIEQWYDIGNKKFEQVFNINEYKIKYWFLNGKLMKEYSLIDDKKNGKYSEYYVNGNVKIYRYYNNGILDGICNEWFMNGNKKIDTEYSNGRLIEKYKKIYKNNQEIPLSRSIKLKSNININLNFKFNHTKIKLPIINTPIRKPSEFNNLYDKYKDTNIIYNEIKDKKELKKTNIIHYDIKKSVKFNDINLILDDKKFVEIN